MISLWIGVAALAAIALLPLALSLRRATAARSRREAALALHRAQLAELSREFEEGRLGARRTRNSGAGGATAHARCGSAVGPRRETATGSGLWVAVALVPIAAVLLYRRRIAGPACDARQGAAEGG